MSSFTQTLKENNVTGLLGGGGGGGEGQRVGWPPPKLFHSSTKLREMLVIVMRSRILYD